MDLHLKAVYFMFMLLQLKEIIVYYSNFLDLIAGIFRCDCPIFVLNIDATIYNSNLLTIPIQTLLQLPTHGYFL